MFTICLIVLIGKLASGCWHYIFNLDCASQRSIIELYFPFLSSKLELKKFVKECPFIKQRGIEGEVI